MLNISGYNTVYRIVLPDKSYYGILEPVLGAVSRESK